jgi:hypothetical protein
MKVDKTPQRIKIGDLSFDSKSEYHTWLYLEKIKGGLQLGRPFKVDLLPKTSHFQKKYMEIDFWLGYSPANPLFLIEYKGDWITENSSAMSLFKTRLHLMEVNNPAAFGRLLIVGSQELKLPNMITLDELKTKLKGM